MLYTIAKRFLYIFFKLYNRVKVYSTDQVPLQGPIVMVANHVSYLDPLYIGTIFPRKLNFMAKKESFSFFLLRWLLINLGAFPVNRDKSDIGAVKKAINILREGKVLALFPQGGRKQDVHLTEIKQGASYFAVKTNTPILPVYIKGTDNVMPKGGILIRPAKVEIYIGQLIEVSDINSINQEDKITILTEKVKEEINLLAK